MNAPDGDIPCRRYVADETGTRYDVFEAIPEEPHWTVVVCEDRPDLYRDLLRRMVREKLAHTALSVPFRMVSVNLLIDGQADLGGVKVEIPNLDQCVLVLDMDANPAGCDLPGIEAGRRAYAGAEFFRRLPRRIQTKTLLASRLTPFKVNSNYLREYPELHCVLTHPEFVEKQTNVAQPELTDDAREWILGVVANLQRGIAGPTLAPSIAPVYTARDHPDGQQVVLHAAFDGSGIFSPAANHAARYVFTCLCHPHRLLDTAKLVAAITGLPADGNEETGGTGLTTTTRRSDEKMIWGADSKAIRDYQSALQRKLLDVVDAFQRAGKSVAADSVIGSRSFLAEWRASDSTAEIPQLLQALRDGGCNVVLRYVGDSWIVTLQNRSLSSRRRQDGGVRSLAASRSVRKAIDRWLKSEIAPRHDAMFRHLWDHIQRSDDSATVHYSGERVWGLGSADHPWRISLKQVEAR